MPVQMVYDCRCSVREYLHLYREEPLQSRDDHLMTQDAMQSKGPCPLR